MDLSQLNTVAGADAGADLVLRNPATDEPLATEEGASISITLAGYDSKAARKMRHAMANRRMQRTGGKMTAESLEADGIELLCALTLGWQNIVVDGEPLEFSADNAAKLYKRFPWIREQVDAFVGDRANFMRSA